MIRIFLPLLLILTGAISAGAQDSRSIPLPQPRMKSAVSVEEALKNRRTIRTFRDAPLSLSEVSQLLWAAQGVTGTRGNRELRTAPSAGALYGLETYLVAVNVDGIPAGLYRYVPRGHALIPVRTGNFREDLTAASQGQTCVKEGAAILVFTTIYERITKKYQELGQRFAILEAGHASQNVYLQAETLGLGTVAVGSFTAEAVKNALNLPPEEEPLYLMPVGKRE